MNGSMRFSDAIRATQYVRREIIDPSGRGEAFLHSFVTAHRKARVERVETIHGPGRDSGVLWVRDAGDPSELPQDRVSVQTVVCVPIFGRQRQAPIPGRCGDFLGAFSGDRVRWLVFAHRDESDGQKESAQPPAGKAGSPGPRGSQSTTQAPGGAHGRPQGNQQSGEGKKSP